ncbi:DNA polymerase zeta catalytic subunit isoform X2 [Phragmites australis]|uniref:DNA polymerase zeta catalytic subunit isoform X2 n=1 Tax=Phragmites australis TaxID=29695 RepID=UPI002D7779E1|nr:DNA polymerase zeta catalytic subunit isoform X2 [Phragmites australis]
MSSSPEPSTPGTPSPVLSVRIVSLDYYMAPPLHGFDFSRSPFHGEDVEEVPVIRIYGSTPAGQKTCLHIHRVLPYLYVPCPEELHQNIEKGGSYITGLLSNLEKALQIHGPSKRRHVHGCNLVRAKKLYGYHSPEDLFMKIYLYYPHEVTRAATLLLGGAVLNRVFQPYESHIPYLLHFLVDNNLYGMGHVHVKDFKFRPPLPDDFHPKSSVRRKAHTDNSEIKNPTVWISSTVSCSSILSSSAASDCLGGTNLNFANRQSSLMLEVDSRVECILNEKYKMYTSLSQTTADTKMVQSLVAIWEELERLRLLEETEHSNLGKPLREEALKSFLHGIKYESALSMLFSQEGSHHKVSAIEESERLERCFKSLTDIIGTVTFSQDDCCDNIGGGNSVGTKDEKQNASLCSGSSKRNVQTISPERNSQFFVSASVAQRTLSQLYDEGEKRVDAEALGLLSWLASSQAAEEPTTDDELINEAILSPLFAKKSIEVALESAHLDFDSASQQECQDILDSVDPVSAAEEPNMHTSYLGSVRPDSNASLSSIIPQVDGSSDEKPKDPREYDKSKIIRKIVGSPSYTSTKNSSKSAGKRAGTEHPWGSLPLSIKKRPHGNADDSASAMPSQKDLSSSCKSTIEKNSHGTTCSTVRESSSFVGEHDSVCHSVRDLMRRKRYFRPEQLEFGSSGAVTCTMDKENKIVNFGALEFHDFTSDISNSETPYSRDEYLHMTFAQKPPLKNQVCSSLESPSGCEQRESAKLGLVDLLPFFNQNMEENKHNESFQYMESSEFAGRILGVPTHFQNDGSALYLLTHALLPPSAVAVGQWLTQQSCSGYPNYGEGVPADKEEASGSTLSPNSPNRSAWENSTTKFAVDADVVESALSNKESKHLDNWHDFSQISAGDEKDKLTPLSQIGFRDPAGVGGGQQLTILSVEVLTESRGELRPDPRFDAINAVSLAIEDDADNTVEVHVFVRDNNDKSHRRRNLDGIAGCNVDVFPEENDLLNNLISAVCSIDPDILVGWEIQLGSLGFLAERAAHLGIGLLKRISRTPPHELNHPPKNPVDESSQVLPEASSADDVINDVSENDWSHTHASGIHIGGRIVLNLWRLMRAEVKLNNYSLEAVADEVLRQKIPLIPSKILNRWFGTGPGRGRHRCIEYISNRARVNLEIMNQLDLVNRTSELARVFGIDFFSVLSRGSQYRVESMLLRLAHTQNYLAISPGNQQVASQPAMECLPLVMEPESAFYPDPVVVLDFQSLYPSMIIAYNLCYSTCLGKVFPSKSNVLGVSSYSADPHTILDLKNQLLVTPNGVLYVQPEVRKGVLPRLLEEILSTRIMVKQAMKKLGPSQQVLHRIFNARQLALKLIANVTYGYTAAGFSGRMPCAELADSIVQCGRRTLETAIAFVNQHPLWKARVVYGDTDSMFVLLKGRSREEAFRIGKEIASAITAINPDPVTLKFEKVYHPCFLLTKKRYVGYSYESPEQNEPIFDAKGIETVRRDTCPAVAKILERSLRIMFEEQDLTKVRSYLERQWARILSGKVSIRDFIFAKEVRLGTYSTRASTLPPAAIVATKGMLSDPRAEPRYAERVPYVVIHGEPGARLVDMVIDPYGLLEVGSPYRLNELYYIVKQIIPALQRVFGLLGADLNKWFNEMPRPIRPSLAKRQSASGHRLFSRDGSFIRLGLNKKASTKGGRIDTYYMSSHCSICGDIIQGSDTFCNSCLKNEAIIATVVAGRTSKLEREIQHLAAICGHCGGADWIVESGVKCISLACPVFYERRKIQRELRVASESAGEAGYYPFCCAELF